MKLSQPTRILLALILGLAIGIVAMSTGQAWTEGAADIAEPIGGLWLNALQMTIVPLVVSLIITGIAGAAEAASSAVLASIVGTTGASVLLIRPFLRINDGRVRPLHIVFFIFIVSNCGKRRLIYNRYSSVY